MDLRSVECFLKVAETLHFARAATELHVSQPALSQRIKPSRTRSAWLAAAWIGDRPSPTARRFLEVVEALV
ncbi:MAG: LysR family transcriptional regulator [Mycobacterium sp.]|jgi:predicted transcriptional regulator